MIDLEKCTSSEVARNTEQCGVTIVAFYGDEKPPVFRQIIDTVSDRLTRELGSLFVKYPLKQIHATLIGLEGEPEPQGIVNLNLRKRYGTDHDAIPPMDFEGLLEFMRCASRPFPVQIGGFSETNTNPYDLNMKPWARTFDIQSNGLVVMIGWPCFSAGLPFSPTLLGIRKYLERFGIVHKYHIAPQDQDNDLFFVIGALRCEQWQKDGNDEVLEKLKNEIRVTLSQAPSLIEMNARDIRVVKYRRTTLETVIFAKPIRRVTERQLRSLY